MSTQAHPPGARSSQAPPAPINRRLRWRIGAVGWTAIGVLGLLGGAWMLRAPLAHALIGQALTARGIDHAFTVDRLDFSGASVTELRLGSADSADLRVKRLDLTWVFAPLPALEAVNAEGVLLQGRLTENGLTWGSLDRLLAPSSAQAEPLAPLGVTLRDAQAEIATPMGIFAVVGEGAGRLRTDFRFQGRLSGPAGLAGEITGASLAEGDNAQASLQSAASELAGWRASDLVIAADAAISLDGAMRGQARFSAANINGPGLQASAVAANADGGLVGASPAEGRFDVQAESLASDAIRLDMAAVRGGWRLAPTGLTADAVLDDASNANRLRLTPQGQQALAALSAPVDTPFGAPLQSIQRTLRAAGQDARLSGSLQLDEAGMLRVGSWALNSRSGASLTLKPDADGFAVRTDGWGSQGGFRLALTGGGTPQIDAAFRTEGDALKGRLTMAPVRASDAELDILLEEIALAPGQGRYALDGLVRASGPLAGGRVEGLAIPLALEGRLGEGFSVTAQNQKCLSVQAQSLTAAGGVFSRPSLAVCPVGGDFLRRTPDRGWTGGAKIAGKTFDGVLDQTQAETSLAFDAATLQVLGETVVARIERPRFAARLEDGPLTVVAGAVEARISPKGVTGALREGEVAGEALPVTIENATFAFRTDGQALRLFDGSAEVRDRPPPSADSDEPERDRFNPLSLRGVEGVLDEGVLTTRGDVILLAKAEGDRRRRTDRKLGGFTARHVLAENFGGAVVDANGLMFGADLDAYEISDPIRGIASDVRGKLDSSLDVEWRDGVLRARGAFTMTDLTFNTAALGPIEAVNGTIAFDDLLAVRSAPMQTLKIGRIDPGIGVLNGEVAFQVLSPTQIRLERAQWPFSAGTLSIDPQVFSLDSPTTRLTVQLAEVDLPAFVEALGLKDIAATGRIAGSFPLQFSQNAVSGEIIDGMLKTLPGGGTLAYSGPVGEALSGPPRIAFDALQGMKFDALQVRVNGPLAGEIEANIVFTGVNTAPIRDFNSLASIPGARLEDPTGVPFAFDVSVTAPFRKLLESYQGTVDAWSVAQRALEAEDEAVDRIAPAPR